MAWSLCDRKGHIPRSCQTPSLTREHGIHPIISVSNIHPYLPDRIPERLLDPRPNLILVDGSEEYEVESIADSKYRYRRLHYLVKFKGWPDSDNEWLPADHLANAPDIIQIGRAHV